VYRMSWSDQQTTDELFNQHEVEQLRRNYADAELAYQSLKRDYNNVLEELSTTKRRMNILRDKTNETSKQFEQLKVEVDTKTEAINQLITQNQNYFNQLDESSQTLDKRVKQLVSDQLESEKQGIIRMELFAEYFPTILSLIALTSILYFIFGT